MNKRSFVTLATLFAVIAGFSLLATIRTSNHYNEAAVAAALSAHLAEFVGKEAVENTTSQLGPVAVCLEQDIPLQIEAVADHLSETNIRLSPIGECTSERIEQDFGIITAITTYYDPEGENAGHLRVANVTCASTSDCIVDIDGPGHSGDRYWLKRRGQNWEVVNRRNRWIA